MDLPGIVIFFDRKRLSAREIHNDIVAMLGPTIVGYNTVTRYLREANFPLSTEETSDARNPKPINGTDEAILSALNENLFASVRRLSQLTQRVSTTVYRHLTQSFGFTARHLCWVPHALSDWQKPQRVASSGQLLRILEVQQGRAGRDIVTLDESGFP